MSFDFSYDETCALYAEFIDSSPNIKKINFGEGTGNRKISVEFKAAKPDQEGLISIRDKDTSQIIVQIPTNRTTDVKF